MAGFVAKRVRFQNGERTSVLLRPDGVPVHEVVLFLARYRRIGRAANTLHLICGALGVLYRALASADVDLLGRLREGAFLTRPELERVATACQFRADEPESAEPTKAGNVINLRTVHPRLKSKPTDVAPLDPDTQGTRIRYIASFLLFIADYVATELGDAKGDRLRLAAKRQIDAFKAGAPRNGGRAKVGTRQGLAQDEEDRLVAAVRPGSPTNPWARGYTQERNFLIVVHLLALGLRRGELLGLRINDIGQSDATVKVLRRADVADDPRRHQPNAKTNDRVVELHPSIARCLMSYINGSRRQIQAARKHPYIFVAQDGSPLSMASIDKIFRDIRSVCPGLSVRLTSHVMRHTWNDRFSEEADKLGLSETTEARARNAQQGWSDNSRSSSVYTRRHAAKVGRRVSIAHQEKLSESLGEK